MLPAVKTSPRLFIVLSILTGLVGSFVNPLMSLFLVQDLNAQPIYIGLYTVSVTLSGLAISQWLGQKADAGLSARKMYIFAVLAMAIGLAIYANVSSFWLVLLAGIAFVAVGNAAIPQMLTISRQWANQTDKVDVGQFNANLRAAISFAWIAGPAIGFALASAFGFFASFYMAAICAVVAAIFAYKFIPDISKSNQNNKAEKPQAAGLAFWLLGISVTLGSVANILYSSSMPLYVIRELGFAEYTPGVFMGLVACLEIPVMLYSSKLAKSIGKTRLIAIAYLVAMSFYIGVYFAEHVWQFIGLQFINAIFYGLFAGLSLTLLQEELPQRIGFTSAFYSNAIKVGMMLGSTLTGFIGQFYTFRNANLAAAVAILSALLCLLAYVWLKQKNAMQPDLTLTSQAG
ncbi:sugar efflux transporter [Catenovulum agarivorans]|uniref:sugar efflux transporter n=1 Tax=Catenovulum agarivorans TaxID=1172192 RepID=UPI0002FAB6EF|nr:sugar efflux transporter [Catenovulum agarivorans]